MSSELALQPREYQQKIAQAALADNTLVVLPTGLGKTMVAILVARSRLEKGKVVMLAPTKPLVLQHCRAFKETLRLGEGDACALTGELDPDERSQLWRRSRFIFATPQTVRNDVKVGRVELKDVALMVFDEAHRSVKDYSYTELARLYKDQAQHPLILGLTASPGGSRQKVDEIKRNLFIEKVEARSEEDEDVRPYVEQTKFEAIKVPLPQQYEALLRALREIYNEKITRLTEAGFLPRGRVSKKILLDSRTTMVSRLNGVGRGGPGSGFIFGSLINQAQAVIILHALELLETQGITVLRKYLVRLREKPEQGKSASALLRDERWLFIEKEAERQKDVVYPKLERLAEIAEGQMALKDDSKIIVFTQYRDTIETIIGWLAPLDGVRCTRFVGQANKAESEGMGQAKQTDVLERFRSGEFNILVSSSIGEEGLHVPDVDLVVFYEAVPSEIRSIQRKGRTGRTKPGRVVLLLAEGTVDEAYYYSSLQREKSMKNLVSSSSSSAGIVPAVAAGAAKKKEAGTEGGRKKPVTLLDYM